MGQGLHTGKIVLTQTRMTQPRSEAAISSPEAWVGSVSRARGCWPKKAQSIWSCSRVGHRLPKPPDVLDELAAAGVRVQVEQCDVSDFDQMRAVIERARTSMPPLRGILHAAGITDDGLLSALTLERFREVMRSKVQGGWHLHTLTENLPLDFFVTFSSSAALLGSAGQGNYVAANAFLDALCSFRQARGLPGLSIQWGIWSGVGMGASVDESHHRRWAAMGVIADLARGGHADALATPAGLRWRRSRCHSDYAQPSSGERHAVLQRAQARNGEACGRSGADILRRLADMAGEEKAKELLRFLSEQIVNVLALGSSFKVDPARSLMDLGLDSLMAMELRNRLQSSLTVTVPVDELLQGDKSCTAFRARAGRASG